MKRWFGGIAAIAAILGFAAPSAAATWKVDKAHTTVGFSVKHLFTKVQGRFDDFDGAIEFDPEDPKAAKVSGTIQAASINTNNAKRDTHLRSPDFFDVEKHPAISFESSGTSTLAPAGDGYAGKLEGKLTIHGVTRAVVIDVEYLGQGSDPWGNVRAGFTGRIAINRKDYGLNWNEVLEAGGVLVGDVVEIQIDAEGLLGN